MIRFLLITILAASMPASSLVFAADDRTALYAEFAGDGKTDSKEDGVDGLAIEESVRDWGKIFHGQVVEQKFKLENRGKTPITIKEIKTNCGCTFASKNADGKTLAAGDSVEISLRIESAKLPADQLKRGEPVRKSGTVITKDGKTAGTFWLQGSVQEVLRFDRESVNLQWIRGSTGSGKKQVIRASVLIDRKVDITSARCAKNLAGATFRRSADGKSFDLELTPVAPAEGSRSRQSDTLEVATTIAGNKVSIPLPVFLSVKDRIECSPSASFFFTKSLTSKFREGGATPTKVIDIKSLGDAAHTFRISKVSAEKSAVKTKLETVVKGKHYRLTIELLPIAADVKRLLRERIVIETDDKLVPKLTITGTARL